MAHKKVNLPQKIRLLMDCYLTEEKKEKKIGKNWHDISKNANDLNKF